MLKQLDIVIATIPKMSLEPLSSPALLKSVIEKEGFTCKTMDFNIDLWHRVRDTKWSDLLNPSDITFSLKNNFDKTWHEYLSGVADEWVESIGRLNPRWLGVSIFSERNILLAKKLLPLIREKLPNIKIIIGGAATKTVYKFLKEKKYIDAYVLRDGEVPIVGALRGEFGTPGLNENSPKILNDLKDFPFLDYSNYDFNRYPSEDCDYSKVSYGETGIDGIAINGSRGCINRCAYCDNRLFSPKFLCRDGEDLANEMIFLQKKYPELRFFNFTDALINGNIKEMRKMSKILSEYNKDRGRFSIKWGGRFICRSEKQMNADDYKLFKESGLNSAGIGIESASERVRRKMNKFFTNEDMDFTITQCEKNNIRMTWGIIVGYPGETEEDFQETLDFFSRYAYLAKKNVMNMIDLGPTLGIIPGTKLYREAELLGITYTYSNQRGNWTHKETGNTMEVRIERWMRLRKHCIDLGYNVNDSSINMLKLRLKSIKEEDERGR